MFIIRYLVCWISQNISLLKYTNTKDNMSTALISHRVYVENGFCSHQKLLLNPLNKPESSSHRFYEQKQLCGDYERNCLAMECWAWTVISRTSVKSWHQCSTCSWKPLIIIIISWANNPQMPSWCPCGPLPVSWHKWTSLRRKLEMTRQLNTSTTSTNYCMEMGDKIYRWSYCTLIASLLTLIFRRKKKLIISLILFSITTAP